MRADYMGIVPTLTALGLKEVTNPTDTVMDPLIDIIQPPAKRGRGRPKGAASGTLSEVRTQAAEEKRKLREELTAKIEQSRTEYLELEAKYRNDVQDLQEALRISEQREAFFRSALEERLHTVAEHLHKSLVDWADAELSEGQITQRKRGRPRKTFK